MNIKVVQTKQSVHNNSKKYKTPMIPFQRNYITQCEHENIKPGIQVQCVSKGKSKIHPNAGCFYIYQGNISPFFRLFWFSSGFD